MTARKAKNVEPYLKLIGYSHLQKQMGDMFVIASIWTDELEKLIDSDESKELDSWVSTYIYGSVSIETYCQGLIQLQTLPVSVCIQAKAADLLLVFQQTKIIPPIPNEQQQHPVSIQGHRGSNYIGL